MCGRIPVLPEIMKYAYGVPNLELDDFSGDMYFFGGELDSHGGVALAVEPFRDEHGEEGAFAHGGVPDQDELEDEVEL